MVTLLNMITVFEQWVQLWDQFLHKYGFRCHRILWLTCLPVLILHGPILTGVSSSSTSKVLKLVIFRMVEVKGLKRMTLRSPSMV
jgi:hypothetical protein